LAGFKSAASKPSGIASRSDAINKTQAMILLIIFFYR
jgi:hypothetical protein